MTFPGGSGARFCVLSQRVEPIDAEGYCVACGERVIGWQSDTSGFPHRPPSVEGTNVTEEVNTVAPEAGQPEQSVSEAQPTGTPAEQPQTETPAGAEQQPGDVGQPPAPEEPEPVQTERPAEGSSASSETPSNTEVGGPELVGSDPNAGAQAEQPAPEQPAPEKWVVVHGPVPGPIVGPFGAEADAEGYRNRALAERPGVPVNVVKISSTGE